MSDGIKLVLQRPQPNASDRVKLVFHKPQANIAEIGGVRYDATKFTARKLPETQACDGASLFELTAKNGGERIVFSDQNVTQYPGLKKRSPSVELNTDTGIIYNDNNFTIKDIAGFKFTSSKKTVANVKLEDCWYGDVDLANNNSRVYGDKCDISGGNCNKVRTDKKDRVTINDKKAENGFGIVSQVDRGPGVTILSFMPLSKDK